MAKRLAIIMAMFTLMAAGCLADTPPPQPPSPTGTALPQPTFTSSPSPSTVPPTPSPASTSPPPTSTPVSTAAQPSPTPSPQAVPPTSTPALEPSAYLDVVRQGGMMGHVWNLADVRYATHPDRLRVVWEMVEPRDHVPRFEVVEVDNTASPFPMGHDPSWGAARIDLIVSDLYAFDFPLHQRLPLVPPDNLRVTRIDSYPVFDDALLGFSIGLKAPSAYEVHELTGPVRIVIDVLWR
ncbi:MAG: hypothetical protein ISS49_05435 [Anaerolineae bacterium]|nr:hypothetical protein [Anaerolineae bacterium]